MNACFFARVLGVFFLLMTPSLAAARAYVPGTAAFEATNTAGSAPLVVKFENTSVVHYGTPSYHWDFGDGTTSTETDPVHVYATAGVFTVRLTQVIGSHTSVEEKLDLVSTGEQLLVADFEDPLLCFEDWSQVPARATWQGDGWLVGDGYLSYQIVIFSGLDMMNGDDEVLLGPNSTGGGGGGGGDDGTGGGGNLCALDCGGGEAPARPAGRFSWVFDLDGVIANDGSEWRMFSLLRDPEFAAEASQLVNVDLRFRHDRYWIRYSVSQGSRWRHSPWQELGAAPGRQAIELEWKAGQTGSGRFAAATWPLGTDGNLAAEASSRFEARQLANAGDLYRHYALGVFHVMFQIEQGGTGFAVIDGGNVLLDHFVVENVH